MLYHILYQIRLRKWPLGFLVLSWLFGAYAIYLYKDHVFAKLSYFFSSPTIVDLKQDTKKAYPYFKSARLRIQEQAIHLALMRKSCRHIPIRHRHLFGSKEELDLLERIEDWRISPELSIKEQEKGQLAASADFPSYWKNAYAFVLASMKDILDAMQYAYEIKITEKSQERGQEEYYILPRFFEDYAYALCQAHLATYVWGEYAAFQEKRAARQIQKRENAPPKEAQVMRYLRGKELYIEALRSYIGNKNLSFLSADGRLMNKGRACAQTGSRKLLCFSLPEAIQSYKKLLQVDTASSTRAQLYFHLAHAYYLLSKERELDTSRAGKQEPAALQSMRYLELAGRNYAFRPLALLHKAALLLEQGEYQKTLRALQNSRKQLQQASFSSLASQSFTSLSRKTFNALGRHKEADCFAHFSDKAAIKAASYCRKTQYK